MDQPNTSPTWILSVAARSACPRCGKGKLFDGFLTLAPRCDVCGLDYSFADPADGPAFFSMMFMAIPATAFGIWLELTYEPPLWVHAVTTLPVMLLLCVPPLRFLKGALVTSQYVNKAEEARFTIEPGTPPETPDRPSLP
jgi:uncharacterized protein (DUF983 family)